MPAKDKKFEAGATSSATVVGEVTPESNQEADGNGGANPASHSLDAN